MGWKILESIVVIGIIMSLVFGCNPLAVSRINGLAADSLSLEDIYSRTRPYVKLEHMILTDSGYYTVTKNDHIKSRFYMADLGEQRCFIELSEDFLEDYPKSSVLEDVSLNAKLIPSDSIVAAAAASEKMEPEQYRHDYQISSIAVSEYRNNIAGVYIYYALAILLAIGIFCQILQSAKQKNTKERQVDYEK